MGYLATPYTLTPTPLHFGGGMKRQTTLFSVLKFGALACLLASGGVVPAALAAPPKAAPEKSGLSQAEAASLKTSAEASCLTEITQDASGDLWGIIGFEREPREEPPARGPFYTIARWNGSHWNIQEFPPGMKGDALKLAAAPDGGIITLYSTGEVLEFRSGATRLLTKIPFHSEQGSVMDALYADPFDIWVTTDAGDIFHADRKAAAQSEAKQVYKSNPDNFFPVSYHNGGNGQRSYYVPLAMTKDALGRSWFWARSIGQGRNEATLRGFLLWDGAKMRYLPEIKGIPNGLINPQNKFSYPCYDCVAQRDPDHLWIAVDYVGMFSMDIHNMIAAPVSEPEKGEFNSVQKMQPLGADWAVIAGPPFVSPQPDNVKGLSGNLWLLHEGVWKKALTGLDMPSISPLAERPLAMTPEGLWIGSFGNSLWLIPADGTEPRSLDWRYGNSATAAKRFFKTKAQYGGLVTVSSGLPVAAYGALLLHTERFAFIQPDKTIVTLQTPRRLLQDSNGAIWNIAASPGAKKNAGTLDRWDGATWAHIPLPPEANIGALNYFSLDKWNRLWVELWKTVPGQAEYRVFIYSLSSKTWVKYPTWEKALEAQAEELARNKTKPSAAPDYRWYLSEEASGFKAYGPDFSGGKACYGDDFTIHYFDGAVWHKYTRPDIVPGDKKSIFEGPAFFDAQGTLSVNTGSWEQNYDSATLKTWQTTDGQSWFSSAYQRWPYDNIREFVPEVAPPADSVKADAYSLLKERNGSFVKDKTGTFWFTANGMLYRLVSGRCAPQFAPDAPNPFCAGRHFNEVLIDQRGNAVIHTDFGYEGEYLFIPVRP